MKEYRQLTLDIVMHASKVAVTEMKFNIDTYMRDGDPNCYGRAYQIGIGLQSAVHSIIHDFTEIKKVRFGYGKSVFLDPEYVNIKYIESSINIAYENMIDQYDIEHAPVHSSEFRIAICEYLLQIGVSVMDSKRLYEEISHPQRKIQDSDMDTIIDEYENIYIQLGVIKKLVARIWS